MKILLCENSVQINPDNESPNNENDGKIVRIAFAYTVLSGPDLQQAFPALRPKNNARWKEV